MSFGWFLSMLAQKFSRIAMNGCGRGWNRDIVIEVNLKWVSVRLRAFHQLRCNFYDVNRCG